NGCAEGLCRRGAAALRWPRRKRERGLDLAGLLRKYEFRDGRLGNHKRRDEVVVQTGVSLAKIGEQPSQYLAACGRRRLLFDLLIDLCVAFCPHLAAPTF